MLIVDAAVSKERLAPPPLLCNMEYRARLKSISRGNSASERKERDVERATVNQYDSNSRRHMGKWFIIDNHW